MHASELLRNARTSMTDSGVTGAVHRDPLPVAWAAVPLPVALAGASRSWADSDRESPAPALTRTPAEPLPVAPRKLPVVVFGSHEVSTLDAIANSSTSTKATQNLKQTRNATASASGQLEATTLDDEVARDATLPASRPGTWAWHMQMGTVT
jgi:hypothetical protein